MTPSGIEPATCRFVAKCLNHYATARPNYDNVNGENYIPGSLIFWILLIFLELVVK